MDFAKEILDAIEIMVKQIVEDNTTKIYTGVCQSSSSNGICELKINGKSNAVKYYGGIPKYNNTYRVFVPFGNMSAAFIIVPGEAEGSSSDITSYAQLSDLPKINNVTLNNNKTSVELGLYGENNEPPYPVTSVNNKTGAITLTASDVGALSSDITIPTVNDATLTIQKNGTSIGTFSANASSNKTVNITVPSDNNELTNGAGYITETALSPYAKSADIPTKTSDLTNDSNYITSSEAPVQSVNAKTGIVVLTQDDIVDGTTYVRTHNDFTDALKQQISTNQSNISALNTNVDNLSNSISGKQDTIIGAGSTITKDNLTGDRALISNNLGKIAISNITSTELGCLDGVSSNVQAQLNKKIGRTYDATYGGKSIGINAERLDGYDSSFFVNVQTTVTQPTNQRANDLWFQAN